jgi:hypothetical protein
MISAGETAVFDFQLEEKPVNVTWMKDNKPLEDPLADRLKFTEGANNSYKLELIHCRESDSGTYIARATNGFENATCTAQLIVEKCKSVQEYLTIV